MGVVPTALIILLLPGSLILKLLRVEKIGVIKTVFYALLLSIVFDFLFIGGCNVLFLHIGLKIFEPVNLLLVCSLGIIILLILGLANEHESVPHVSLGCLLKPSRMFMLGLVPIAVLSTYFINTHHESILQVVLVCVVAILAVVTIFKFDGITKKIAIFSITLTLLLQTGLIGNYLVEWADVFFEYWVPNTAMLDGNWNPSIALITNAMLSLAILPASFCTLSGLELLWFFKIIFPFIISFLPLGMYSLFRTQVDQRSAIIAVFLVIFSSYFFTSLLGLNRQAIATLFLVGVAIVIMDNQLSSRVRAPLTFLFMIGIVLSHYGLAFIAITAMFGMIVLLLLVKGLNLFCDRTPKDQWIFWNAGRLAVVLFLSSIFMIAWYSLVAGGEVIGEYRAIVKSLLEMTSLGSSKITESPIITFSANFMYLDLQPKITTIYLCMIGAGVLAFFMLPKYRMIKADYFVMIIPFFALFMAGYGIIGNVGFVEEGRFIFTTSIFLVLLGVTSVKTIGRRLGQIDRIKAFRLSDKFLAILVVWLLLSGSGVIAFASSVPSNAFLEPWVKERPNFTYPEVRAEKWVVAHTGTYLNVTEDAYPVWADSFNAYLTVSNQGTFKTIRGNGSGVVSSINEGEWVLIGRLNLETGRLLADDPNHLERMYVHWLWLDNLAFTETLVGYSMVYSNGHSQVYHNN